MTFSNINIGLSPNDGTGDVLRTAFQIVNSNFDEVEEFLVSQVTESYLTATLSNYATIQLVQDIVEPIGVDLSTLFTSLDGKAPLVHTHSVSNVTGLQGQLDGKATLTQLNNAIADLNDTIAQLNITISNKIDEAPEDDNSYVRRNGEWIIL
jgi:hypothetical protein